METVTSIGALIGIFTAIFALILNLHVLHEHRRKKFKSELENFEEYFSKYYDPENKTDIPLLIQDKAAQNLTRLNFFNKDLVNYFINLHHQRKLSIDEALDLLFFGHNYIKIENNNSELTFTSVLKFPKTIMWLNYLGYVSFLLYALSLYTIYPSVFSNHWIKILVTISAVIAAFVCANKADSIKESMKFLKLLKNLNLS